MLAEQDTWRVVVGGVLVVLLLPGGCPDLPTLTTVEPITQFDFDELHMRTTPVLDLTNFAQGKTTSAALFQPHTHDGRQPALVYLPEADLWYLFIGDSTTGLQTVYLPGTTNVAHLRLDAQLKPVYDERIGANLHAGFRTAGRRVYQDLLPRLDPNLPVALVGYSMGGGAAVILGQYLTLDGFDIEQVITLGQPAITDAAGVAAFADLPLLRLVAGDDTIPRMTVLDYEHFGETLILLDGAYVVHLPADSPRIDTRTGLLIDQSDEHILDHFSYRLRLQSKVGAVVQRVGFADRDLFLASDEALAARVTAGQL